LKKQERNGCHTENDIPSHKLRPLLVFPSTGRSSAVKRRERGKNSDDKPQTEPLDLRPRCPESLIQLGGAGSPAKCPRLKGSKVILGKSDSTGPGVGWEAWPPYAEAAESPCAPDSAGATPSRRGQSPHTSRDLPRLPVLTPGLDRDPRISRQMIAKASSHRTHCKRTSTTEEH
jgi:hypothetical protein